MKIPANLMVAGMLLAAVGTAVAAVRYVDLNSASPMPPYTNWTTAATNIQDAVDLAAPGDELVVTNGTYASVTVSNYITLRSVNGPQFTFINGRKLSGCAYLADEAIISGFTLTNGLAGNGGGVYCENPYAVVSNCVIVGNSAISYGGGAVGGTLNNCTLMGNSAGQGGGVYRGILNNCALTGNSATSGGGVWESTLNNCTLTGNSAQYGGGGADGDGYDFIPSILNNCIAYFNTAAKGANYGFCILNYCCTTPLPTRGMGNISADPQLASVSHLSAASPCRAAGSKDYITGTDIDGEPWASPPSIGCDEYRPGVVIGALSVGITAAFTNVAAGYPVSLTGLIEGRTSASVWDFGDGSRATNQPFTSHAWTAPGNYTVVLTAYNESVAAGASGTVTIHVVTPPIRYVAAENRNPVAPYTSWATAATNIQDAVDASDAGTVPGAWIVVSNGTYATGERTAGHNGDRYRVAVDRPLVVRSVNGPEFTVIDGSNSIGCVYLAGGAGISGFTLTNGLTDFGAGVYCDSASPVVSNCVLVGNSASSWGGGAYGGTLNNCMLSGNSAKDLGGGAYGSALNNCILTGNSANQGGGAAGSAYTPCTLNNCALTGNSAGHAGGAYGAALNNCSLTGNLAAWDGGGAYGGTLNNCLAYFNTAAQGQPNYSSSILNYCCTTPLPPEGAGNISADPQLTDAIHLGAGSPCRGAGSTAYVSGRDIDGEAWANPPSIGCDEYHAGTSTGPLSVRITATLTNVATGYPVGFTALISGWTSASVWDFGDGLTATNEPYAIHAWPAAGDYGVVLRAYNDSLPAGVVATVTVHVVSQPVHYVAAGSVNPVAPYASWATAASNIQDAVDAATVSGALVLVTNGTYATGGRAVYGTPNRVAVTKPLTLQSVNGPLFTVIEGNPLNRCVYLAKGTTLSGFALTNGVGGVFCESAAAVVSNCLVVGSSGRGAVGGTLNSCALNGNSGGGAAGATLNNCTLIGNYFDQDNGGNSGGGGAAYCTLNNCTLIGNSVQGGASGGGAYGCTLNNCTIAGNSATSLGGGAYYSTLNNCTLATNSASDSGGGAYRSTLYNCTLAGNSAAVGGGAAGSVVKNCTLTGNSAAVGGGAAEDPYDYSYSYPFFFPPTWPSILNNCILTGNSAQFVGGGATSSTLNNCLLVNNSAVWNGGAVAFDRYAYNYPPPPCILNDCTLTGNSTLGDSGGASASALNNCIAYFNTALNYDADCLLNYCCTTPQPTIGAGNITKAPMFVSLSGGNLRLQSNSPCINAGNNGYVVGGTDIDGRPRVVGGTVDIGAYEFQGPGTSEFIDWLRLHGLPTDGSADFSDPDGDHYSNWQEWQAGSDPRNSLSAPPFITAQPISQLVAADANVTLSVTATPTESGLGYQWHFNGTNDLLGATNSSLTLSNVQTANAGLYSVRVTNVFGSILSSNATLLVDRPPVADASATSSLVISVKGLDARVVLDGSRSFDPDGDPLHYEWVRDGSATALATGIVAIVVLPVGTHPVELVVSDGFAASTNIIVINVVTPSQAIRRLLALLNNSSLQHSQPLLATLNAALASIIRGNNVSAANQLGAFKNQVRAQVAPLDATLANALIQAAQQVIDGFADGTHSAGTRVHLLPHQRDGKLQLSFTGLAGRVHLVQASTNLVDWEMIGVAVDHGDGFFDFEDPNPARFPHRFYRLVSP